MSDKRESGWYWVKSSEGWQPVEYDAENKDWLIFDGQYAEWVPTEDLLLFEIGDKVEVPEKYRS